MSDWLERARALGWPDADLAGLRALLAMPGNTAVVAAVTRAAVTTDDVAVYRLAGTGADGRVRVHEVRRPVRRVWHRRPAPESVTAPPDAGAPWCPLHATACAPTVAGCGARGVVARELCGCGRRHDAGCELGAAIVPPPPRATTPPPPEPTARAAPARRGVHPGQLALSLGPTRG